MNELYHHGIKGQKWGVRRYQNKDGSLTAAGKNRNYNKRNMKNADTQHLDKWGTDEDHNILYIYPERVVLENLQQHWLCRTLILTLFI